MSVIVDTPIWSEAFRRRKSEAESFHAAELRRLISQGEALLLGPIRQEILSGIRNRRDFLDLGDSLRAFPDYQLWLGRGGVRREGGRAEEATSCLDQVDQSRA